MNHSAETQYRDRGTQNALALALGDRKPQAGRLLPHERMDAFRVAIELVELISNLHIPRGYAAIVDQLRRASASIALNIAEGCGKQGRDRQRFFGIARGSTLESAAALRVLMAMRAIGPAAHDTGRTLCDRLYAMLTQLTK